MCRGSETCLDIAHGNRKSCRWTEPTGSNSADLATGFIKEISSTADRLAAFRLEADTFGRCALGDRVQHGLCAVECSLFAHRLGDCPNEASRNRIGFRRYVLTVQAETGFKAQTVASGKTNPFDALVGKQFRCKHTRFIGWQADLETVFAGIARTGHEPASFGFKAAHESKLGTGQTGIIDDGFRFRALNGEEYAVERIDFDVLTRCGFIQMLDIGIGIASVSDDHETVFAKARDDQIVQHTAVIIEEESVFRLTFLQHSRVKRTGFGKKRCCLHARNFDQLHMRNIEKARMFTRMKMLLHYAQRIGDRHVPASKAAEARASLFMQILQRQGIQMCGIAHNNSRVARVPPQNAVASCPSVSGLRDSHSKNAILTPSAQGCP